jgi:maltodextrin utilization protein YvdJ
MKNFLSYLWKTLYKNESVVEAGRTISWWQPLILVIFAIFISIIPTFTSAYTADGGAFISSPTYNIDDGLTQFSAFLNEKDFAFDIDSETKTINSDENKISLLEWNTALGSDEEFIPAPWTFEQEVMDVIDGISQTSTTRTILEVYNFTDFEATDLIVENINRILMKDPLLGYNTDTTNPEFTFTTLDTVTKTNSFMIIAKSTYAIYKFPYASTSYTSTSGNYNNQEISSLKELSTIDSWKTFVRQGYIDNKNYITLLQTGIVAAVNAGIVILMGLMLFIMTRGKNNPYRDIKFIEANKMAWWASFSPALISLVLGYTLSSLATVAFVMCYGIRVMFLSMKNLRPQYK